MKTTLLIVVLLALAGCQTPQDPEAGPDVEFSQITADWPRMPSEAAGGLILTGAIEYRLTN